MTTIIATIKPFYLNEIRRGRKTIEVRKTVPKCDYPVRVLLCESGSGGQIKAEFIMKRVLYGRISWFKFDEVDVNSVADEACLSRQQIIDYAGVSQFLYFWKISDMIDYCSTKGYHVRNISEFGLKRPPQSWQYVKEGE